jgi:penicillin-binding protein 1A
VDDSSKATNDLNPAAMALGAMTYGVTPLEMALAYGTFPNGGKRNSAICYTEILDSEGKRILEKVPVQTQVLDEGVAYIMTDVLKSVVSRGIAGNASIYGTHVGGKTGTTNDTYDIWFCGFTPLYSAALWIGTDHNVQMGGTSTQAAYLWSKIMRQIPDITDGEYKEMPSDVVYRNGEYYTSGTEPYAGYYNSRNSWGYNNYGNGTGGWRRY